MMRNMKTSNKLSTVVHKKTRVFVTDGTAKVIIAAGSVLELLSTNQKGPITHIFVADDYPYGEKLTGIYPIENIFYCELDI